MEKMVCPKKGCGGLIQYEVTAHYAVCEKCGKRIRVQSQNEEKSILSRVATADKKKTALFSIFIIALILIGIISVPVYRKVQYEIGIEKQLKDAQEFVTAKKYMDAIEIYGSVPEQSRHFEEANKLIQSTKEGYRDFVIQSSSELLKNSQYEAAYKVIQQGKADLGELEELIQQENVVRETIITAVTPSVKIIYKGGEVVEGDKLDPSLFTIKLDYLGLYQIDGNAEQCEPQIVENAGETEIKLSYEKEIYSWDVTVIPKVQQITAEYIGDELTRGDNITIANFKVIGTCTDSSTREIKNFDLSNTVLENYGNNLITVSYGDLSCECYVKAKPQKTGIQLSTKNSQYERGKTIGVGELVVELVYEDGSKENIDSALCTFEGRSPKKIGSNILKAKYDGFTATTEVTGIEYVSLKELKMINKRNTEWATFNYSDIMGNTYENPLTMVVAKPNEILNYGEWYVGGKYNLIEGRIATQAKSPEYDYQVLIYADDTLVYSSKECNRRIEPFKFSASIANADYLRIETKLLSDNYGAYTYIDAILSDLVLVMTK